MKIWLKVVFVVLPILFTTLVIGGISSFFVAVNGVNRVTTEFLDFKVSELERHMASEWDLLAQNGLTGNPVMVQATQAGIEVYARSLVRGESELILAVDPDLRVVMATDDIALEDEERDRLAEVIGNAERGLQSVTIAEIERVAMSFSFEPFGWFVFVSEGRDAFYTYLNRITVQTIILILGGSTFSILLILFFVRFTMQPLSRMAAAMKTIISSNDLSERVEVEHDDEIGQVSHTFNIMIGELDKAYNTIKQYAFEAVVAQKKEMKIRNIFQKYVPQELIDRFFVNPDAMLVGENREIAVLFSDIRSFTTISERMSPDDLVNSLNRYFSVMVDIIMNRNGVVDKYIGDAIMAIFGAPVRHDDDPLQSVRAGMEMVDAVKVFNQEQLRTGKPEFRIGVGIAYGEVTVGNIGTERKMDYTVIGDMVNLASRLEGLTKLYRQDLIISESLYEEVKNEIPCRLIDAVAVKGKHQSVRIYTAHGALSAEEERALKLHNEGMELYFNREFNGCVEKFDEIEALGKSEHVNELMLQRCRTYENDPPPSDWDGVEIIKSK